MIFRSRVVEVLAAAVDAKDAYTNGHSGRVAEYARQIARRFGCSESKVKMTCKRVRDRLSQYLKKEGYIL